MPIADKLLKPLRSRMWIRTAVTLVIGFVCFGVHTLFPTPYDHLIRDIGMAFIVAAIVTAVYERYAREAAATETAEDIVSKLIGDIVDAGVWREMREQILEKVAVRRSTTIQLKLGPQVAEGDPRHVLWVGLQYRLTSLRSRAKEVSVLHFLDSYMRDSSLALPRFLRIVVAGTVQKLSPGQDRFEQDVAVQPLGEVPIVVEREELVYIPGAYSLIVSDLTQIESVALWEKPVGSEVTLNCMFDECPLALDKAYVTDRFLLPGQTLEFRFTHTKP